MISAIRVHETGGPEMLRWEEIELDDPGPGEVRLKHSVIGVNYIDVYHRNGLYPMPLPFIPGTEGSGVVMAIGAGMKDFKPGDRVAYAMVRGAYAQERLIAADRLVLLPDTISDMQAASLMLQGLTAHYLLRQVFPVAAGDTILIHAAAGGVGQIVCQWASHLGATVIGTVSSDAKAEIARAAGCHHAIVYSREDFLQRVLEITEGCKLPVVYDSVGADTFAKSLDCLRPRGTMVLFGQSSGPVPLFDLGILATKGSLSITRPTLATFYVDPQEFRANAAEMFALVTSGHLRVGTPLEYKLSDAAQAHTDLEARKTTGSIVLIP